jgi:hypothetical protein
MGAKTSNVSLRSGRVLMGLTMAVATLGLGIIGLSAFSNKAAAAPVAANRSCCSNSPLLDENVDIAFLVKLAPSSTTSFRVNLSDGDLTSGGTWAADFGSVNSSGDYTAPSYMPPYGIDTVTYTDPDGHTASLAVRLTPTGTPPADIGTISGMTQSEVDAAAAELEGGGMSQNQMENTQTPPGDTEIIDTSYAVSVDPYKNYDENDPLYDVTEQTLLVADDQVVPEPVPTFDCEVTAATTYGGQSAYVLPAMVDGLPSEALVALLQTGQSRPQKCKVGPFNQSHQGEPCTGALHTYKGTTTVTPGDWVSMGSQTITISGSMSADIWKFFHISIGAGSTTVANVMSKTWTYKKVTIVDNYKCVNGHLQYVGSQKCVSYAIGLTTIPPWFAFATGYPRNGAPGPWTPPVCNPYP